MWYTKYNLKNKGEMEILCPNCSEPFENQTYYTIEGFKCRGCLNYLHFFRSKYSMLYLINLEAAPPLYHLIHNYLKSLTPKQAGYEFNSLIEMLKE